LTLHTHLAAVHASARAIQHDRFNDQDMFTGEGLGDVLLGVIDRSADECFKALIEIEESLGVECHYSRLTLSNNARARGFSSLAETLGSRDQQADQETQP
jgi:hypothetical protein